MEKRLKISVYTVFEVLVYILAFADIRNNIIKYGLMVVVGVFLVSKVSHELLAHNRTFNVLTVGFSVISLLISFQARGLTNRDPLLANIVFCGIFIEFVLMTEVISERKGIQHFLKTASICAMILCAVTDVLAFTIGANKGIYLIGTKFQVVYHHMLVIGLYMLVTQSATENKRSVNYYKRNLVLTGMIALTILISVRIDCSTGIVGVLCLLAFTWLININRDFFSRPVVFVGFVLLAFGFMWGFEAVLNNKQIITLVTVYLQRSISLTGRTIIYAKMPNVMSNHWMFGYGYGSTYEICRSKIGFADTQNALMEWIMQIGVVGTVALLVVLVYAFSNSAVLKNKKQWVWFAGYIYTLVFIGTVEITYTMYFFAVLILIYVSGTEMKRSRFNECIN